MHWLSDCPKRAENSRTAIGLRTPGTPNQHTSSDKFVSRHVDLGSGGAHLPPFAFARWSAFHPDFRASLRSSAKESSVSEGQLRQRRKGRENKQSAPSKRSESLTKKSCFTLTLRSRPRQGRHVRRGSSLQQAQPYRCDRSGFVNERPARKPARSAV